jgi:hypothetical protein
MMFSFILAQALAEECESELRQDLNCNNVDERDERVVDLTDPVCVSTRTPTTTMTTTATAATTR